MHTIEEAVHEYVDSRRWDTLVGRAWDMHSPEGKEEFAKFLSGHIKGVLEIIPPITNG
jgi:hypothetical protein